MQLIQTCCGCPEQYDVFWKGKKVGYLRLRHGYFSAQLFGPSGKEVYGAETIGDGVFDESERDFHLKKAQKAIKRELKMAGGPS